MGPTARLEAVLFDVDGTLVDSERHGHRVAFNRAFEAADMPYRWGEEEYGELLKITGGKERLEHYLRGRDGFDAGSAPRLVEKIHSEKTRYFLELIQQGAVPARDGARRLIDELQAAGVTLAIVTTGTPDWVEAVVEQHFGLSRFETVVTGGDVRDKKPDPAAYNVALDRMGLRAASAIALEDSAPGLAAAKRAELSCVVVVNDYTRDQDLSEADLVLDGYGTPEAPAHAVADRHSLGFGGVLDPELLVRTHASGLAERRT